MFIKPPFLLSFIYKEIPKFFFILPKFYPLSQKENTTATAIAFFI